MELGFEMYALAVGAGLVAGLINTLAGSGSLVALAALVTMGLPATVANGTNRVGVLIQSVVGLLTMRRHGEGMPEGVGWILGATTAGALAGAGVAGLLSPEALEWVIIGVLWVTLILVFIKPGEWLREESVDERGGVAVGKVVVFFFVGVWGGFIQASVGVLLLAALVLVAGKNLIEATAIKLAVVLIYTVGALAIFAAYGQVHWGLGLVMGIGQAIGAWSGARFAATSSNAPVWIRRLLVVVILVAAAELMGLFAWLTGVV